MAKADLTPRLRRLLHSLTNTPTLTNMNNTLNACEDCEVICDTSLEDQLAYFNNNRCAECEAKMLKGMEEEQANDKENFFLEMQQALKERTGKLVPMEYIIRDFAKYYAR